MIVFLIAALLKILVITFWLGGFISSIAFAISYNPITGVLLYWALKRKSENKLYPVVFLTLDILIPAVGFIGATLFAFFGYVFRFINYHEEEDDYAFPMGASSYNDFEVEKRFSLEKEGTLERDILVAFDVEPLQEVLLSDSDTQIKISAIEHLGRIGNREAIRILKKGLKDKDYEVRYFSNGALEDIEKQRLEDINKLSEKILENPNEADLYNQRGSAYIEMFRLGLLDKSVQGVFLERSLMDFMTSLSLNSKQSYLYTRIVEVNLLLKNYSDLINLADYALKIGISDEDKAKIYFYQAEANFIKGNLEAAKACCEKANRYPVNFDLIQNCLGWWLHAA